MPLPGTDSGTSQIFISTIEASRTAPFVVKRQARLHMGISQNFCFMAPKCQIIGGCADANLAMDAHKKAPARNSAAPRPKCEGNSLRRRAGMEVFVLVGGRGTGLEPVPMRFETEK